MKEVLALVKKMKDMEVSGLKYCNNHWSGEYSYLYQKIEEQNIFHCPHCGEMKNYFELEDWLCDFTKENYICSECYEDEMGDDL